MTENSRSFFEIEIMGDLWKCQWSALGSLSHCFYVSSVRICSRSSLKVARSAAESNWAPCECAIEMLYLRRRRIMDVIRNNDEKKTLQEKVEGCCEVNCLC